MVEGRASRIANKPDTLRLTTRPEGAPAAIVSQESSGQVPRSRWRDEPWSWIKATEHFPSQESGV